MSQPLFNKKNKDPAPSFMLALPLMAQVDGAAPLSFSIELIPTIKLIGIVLKTVSWNGSKTNK